MRSSRILFCLCFCLGLAAALPDAYAAERRPLTLEGKRSLFQRVVTHPGASLLGGAANGAPVLASVTPFSVLYVYDRKDGFVEVGPSSGAATGWLAESKTTLWPQAMTLLFTARSGRSPVLFFRDEQSLKDVCSADDLKDRLAALESRMADARRSAASARDLPVLASEPSDAEGAVSRDRFYLMPIQQMTAPFEGAKFLQVASIDPGGDADPAKGAEDRDAKGKDKGKPQTMRTGIVFVIDTTISMKNYIEQSLDVIRSAFDDIEKEQLGDSVGFAVIAFRSSTAKNPAVGYTTLKVSGFTTLKDRKKLEKALAGLEEATVSTHAYNEDSLAGVKAAVDELSWEDYHSRVLVLITDAGPLPPEDPLAATGMAPAEILDYAKSKNIWLTVAHIQTPQGGGNRAYAEKAYRELTRTATGESSYMPIAAPDQKTGAASFARTAKALAASLTKVVKVTSERKAPEKPRPPAGNETPEERATPCVWIFSGWSATTGCPAS